MEEEKRVLQMRFTALQEQLKYQNELMTDKDREINSLKNNLKLDSYSEMYNDILSLLHQPVNYHTELDPLLDEVFQMVTQQNTELRELREQICKQGLTQRSHPSHNIDTSNIDTNNIDTSKIATSKPTQCTDANVADSEITLMINGADISIIDTVRY